MRHYLLTSSIIALALSMLDATFYALLIAVVVKLVVACKLIFMLPISRPILLSALRLFQLLFDLDSSVQREQAASFE